MIPVTLPTLDQVRSLPVVDDQVVHPDVVDVNIHMNITSYFNRGSWSAWRRLEQLGMVRHDDPARHESLFVVEHHLRYLGELHLGDRYTTRVGWAETTSKAVRGVTFFVAEEADRLACVVGIVYLNVGLESRRAQPMPADLKAAIDAEIAAHPWVADVDSGVSLRR